MKSKENTYIDDDERDDVIVYVEWKEHVYDGKKETSDMRERRNDQSRKIHLYLL